MCFPMLIRYQQAMRLKAHEQAMIRLKMDWIIEVDRHAAAGGIDWARDFFARYNTEQLLCVRIGSGRGSARGVYGRCSYPTPQQPSYRISCQVPGPFPHQIEVRRPPLYRQPDGSWPQLPAGCVEGVHCSAEQQGRLREWKRVLGYTEVLTLDEGIIWIMAHEAFHFLRRTGQVAGRNTEIEADRFADEQLSSLRTLRQRWSCRS